MQKDNPACYECPKGKGGLHTWERCPDGTGRNPLTRARCVKCNLELVAGFAFDVFEGETTGPAF